MAQPVVEPIESRLGILEPLCIAPAQSREELSLFDWLLWRYHYLPYSGAVGENIKYLVFDCRARPGSGANLKSWPCSGNGQR